MKIKQKESYVVAQLTKEVKLRNWLKYKQEGRAAPDWIIVPQDAPAFFIECKTTGEKPRQEQLWEHERLRKLGQKVYVLDHSSDIDQILNQGREK